MLLLLHVLVIACNETRSRIGRFLVAVFVLNAPSHLGLRAFWCWWFWRHTLGLCRAWHSGAPLRRPPWEEKKDRGQKDEMGQQHCQHHYDLNAWYTQIWDFRTKLASQHRWWHFIQRYCTFSYGLAKKSVIFILLFLFIRKQPYWLYLQ